MQLSVPSVRLTPSLDEVQRAINRSAVAVIGCSKQMWQWGQLHLPELGPDGEQLKTSYFEVGNRNFMRQVQRFYRQYLDQAIHE